MSGGAFDYLYSKFENEDKQLDWWTLQMLEHMAEFLDAPLDEEPQPEAAAELRRYHKRLTEINDEIFKLTTNNEPFITLLRTTEWWASHDQGIEDFRKAWSAYKKKSAL